MPLVIIPSIDLRAGQVVRLQQGDYARQLTYNVDPVQTAIRYATARAQFLHVVDLDGAKAGRPMQSDQLERLAQVPGLRVQAGGGIRSTADIETLLNVGVDRVVVGTQAMQQWDWFSDLVHTQRFAGKLVLAIDARDGIIATQAWTGSSGRRATDVAREVSGWPLAALLYTDVARDGMLIGPNIPATAELGKASSVPVIASGGVGNIDHIRQIAAERSIWGVIVGRSLYEGTLNLDEALAVAAGA